MTRLRSRNIDAEPTAPVETWPTEGVIAALERGGLGDWARLISAVQADPWGPVARRLEDALAVTRPYGVDVLMGMALQRAREAESISERREVAERVAAHLRVSGLSRKEFAEALGTSASRLSTYLSGKVVPSAALLVRMERLARRRALP